MRNFFTGAPRCQGKSFLYQSFGSATFIDILLACTLISLLVLFTGCQKDNDQKTGVQDQNTVSRMAASESNVVNDYTGLSSQTEWELQQARAATARYRHIKNAIKDGYADISVVVPNMGYHYMKSSLTDATFDISHPEILVYNKTHDGGFELVAVEYAVPIELSPDTAPAGFTGDNDEWDRNTGFGLWLLHAWVWTHNPNGVFNPTNPLVHLH